MNLWNKIVLGTKFLFGGFESAVDYLLMLLNEFLAKEKISGDIQKVRAFVTDVLKYMHKYEKYCPAIWVTHYERLMDTIQVFVDVLEDNKVTPEEVEKVKAAIEEWMK